MPNSYPERMPHETKTIIEGQITGAIPLGPAFRTANPSDPDFNRWLKYTFGPNYDLLTAPPKGMISFVNDSTGLVGYRNPRNDHN